MKLVVEGEWVLTGGLTLGPNPGKWGRALKEDCEVAVAELGDSPDGVRVRGVFICPDLPGMLEDLLKAGLRVRRVTDEEADAVPRFTAIGGAVIEQGELE